MIVLISNKIRSVVASLIGIDVDECLPSDEKQAKKFKVENPVKEVTVTHKRTDGDIKERKYKAPPKIKPKRRDNTLSEWDYKDKRKEYTEQYRNEGKDVETGNKYIKKLKGE